MYTIDKRFDICYGHRVWNQTLNDDYTEQGHTCAKCRHIHGHQGAIHVFLESEELKRGMVVDFTWLGWLKDFLDDNLDHKFIIGRDDPIFEKIINGRLALADRVVTRGDPDYPDNGTHENHIVQIEVLKLTDEVKRTNDFALSLVPSYVPGTEHLGGYNLDVGELDGPEQEFYEGFFIVDFLPTSENLSKWVFDCVDAKMKLIDVQTSRVEWFETPKSRSSYSG